MLLGSELKKIYGTENSNTYKCKNVSWIPMPQENLIKGIVYINKIFKLPVDNMISLNRTKCIPDRSRFR